MASDFETVKVSPLAYATMLVDELQESIDDYTLAYNERNYGNKSDPIKDMLYVWAYELESIRYHLKKERENNQ